MNYTKEKLIKKMTEISNAGWHKEIAKGDQAWGRTLENLLGVHENNISLPDYGKIEIKTKKLGKNDSINGLISLFGKEPLPPKSMPKVLNALGWKHYEAGAKYSENEKSLYETITPEKWHSRGLFAEITEDKIIIKFDPSKVIRKNKDNSRKHVITNKTPYETLGDWLDDVQKRENPNYKEVMPVYYERKVIENKFEEKFSNSFFCICDRKEVKGEWHVKYLTGYILQDFKIERLKKIKENGVVIDFRLRTGHNHGTGFRATKENLFSLYNLAEKIL